jgi:hypothetical protein
LDHEIGLIRRYERLDGFAAVFIILVNGTSDADGTILATDGVVQTEVTVAAYMFAPSGDLSMVIDHFHESALPFKIDSFKAEPNNSQSFRIHGCPP